MKISFLNHKYGEEEPVSLNLDDEIGDVVISGFRGDKKLVIIISDAPVEEGDSRADVLAKVCLQRENDKAEGERKLVLLYKIGISPDKQRELAYNEHTEIRSTDKTERFVTVASADAAGVWQPKNVVAIVGMPPDL